MNGTVLTLEGLRIEAAATAGQAEAHRDGLHWAHWSDLLATCRDPQAVAIEESAAHAADMAERLALAEQALNRGEAR